MRTSGDTYEDTAWQQAVETEMALARGERPAWILENDRIGTLLMNRLITQDQARQRLITNGATGREADHQLTVWHRPAADFTAGSYNAEQADYDDGS